MVVTKYSTRASSVAIRTCSHTSFAQKRFFGAAHKDHSRVATAQRANTKNAGLFVSLLFGGGCLYLMGYPKNAHAETIPAPAEVTFEKSRRKGESREDNRDLISSQHLQVKKSWENPGVYAWGNNSGRVVAPDSDENLIKTPRRITYFDGKIIRDIKLDRNFGAAITENGDLLMWGKLFSTSSVDPQVALTGKDFVKLSISRDRVIALSSNGKVYSISASQSDQISDPKPFQHTWFPFWKSKSTIAYRLLEPSNMSWGEKISDISSGLEHCLLLSSKGRLFSAASASEDFPSRGQTGIPGLTWTTRPEGAYDQPHEISTLKGFEIVKIATGDFHSLAVDKQGRVFAFGDNSSGQLGFDYTQESPTIDAPSLLPIDKLYKGTNQVPRVTNVAAGGSNSFFTIDATKVAGQGEEDPRGVGRVTADVFSCGQGIWGNLGNGRWTHVQGTPQKVKALSSLFEYDETKKIVVPIRLAHLSVGTNHASAIMNNVTHVDAHDKSSENDTNWGADVLWWGNNEFYQLGTGKRNNVNSPIYIPPLDIQADKEKGRREEHRFQITPSKRIRVQGRNVNVEQRIECGRGVTAVYSGTG